MSGPRIEPCGTPHDNSPGDEVSFPMLTKRVRLVGCISKIEQEMISRKGVQFFVTLI